MNDTVNKIVTDTSAGLWAGTNNEQVKGDDPALSEKILGYRNWQRRPLEYVYVNSGTTGATGTTGTTGTTTGTATTSGTTIVDLIAQNKWIVIGGVGVLAWFLFSSSLGAQDRTVTSVTRYGRRGK